MDRGAWWARVHGVAKSWTGLSNFPHSVYQSPIPRWCSGKESACQFRKCRKCRLASWAGKIPDVGNGNPPQYSCLENSMDRGAWRATVHGAARVGHNLVTKTTMDRDEQGVSV